MPKTAALMETMPGVDTFMIDPASILVDESLNSRRYSTGKVEEMMADILENGQQEPCKVRAVADGKYQLVFGFRRHKAISNINAEKLYSGEPLPLWCVVVEIDDRQAFLSNVAENVQRAELTPIDKAHAAKQMIDVFGIQQADAARRLDVSGGYISKLLSIANNTPAAVIKQVHKGEMTVEVAYEVSQMEAEAQKEFLAGQDGQPSRATAKKRKRKEAGPKILSGKAIVRAFDSYAEVKEEQTATPAQLLALDIAEFVRGKLSEATLSKRLEKYCKARLKD